MSVDVDTPDPRPIEGWDYPEELYEIPSDLMRAALRDWGWDPDAVRGDDLEEIFGDVIRWLDERGRWPL